MRILIMGARGNLGRALQDVLSADTITGYDLPELDIADRAAVAQTVEADEPELVINAAAYTDVDGCAQNPDLAYRANALGPQNLALVCAAHGIPLLHVSSNEVFPGTRPAGYAEWDPLDPINPYGASKAAGEWHVRSLHRQHYVVRTAWLYAPHGRNFIHAILRFARERGAVRVVTDEVANPTSTADLAHAIGRLCRTGQFGTYHLVNEGACSRWAFANEILRQSGLAHVPNTPILSREFKRASTPPPYCALQNNAAAALGITLRPWAAALGAFLSTLD